MEDNEVKHCLYFQGASVPCHISSCRHRARVSHLCNTNGVLEYDAIDRKNNKDNVNWSIVGAKIGDDL